MRILARRSPNRPGLGLVAAISLTVAVVSPPPPCTASVRSSSIATPRRRSSPLSLHRTAPATKFDADGVDVTIFTGRGSNNDLNSTRWQWRSGSVPPQDDLAHAYAVLYASRFTIRRPTGPRTTDTSWC